MGDRWTKRWKVQSQSNPDVQHTVAIDRQGRWGCSCWAWRRNQARDCKHIETVKADSPEPDEITSITEPSIVLAKVKEVTPEHDGEGRVLHVLTPLIPLDDTWFQATVVYDLLRYGVTWSTVKHRYGLARKNSRKSIVAYVRKRGRKIYGEVSRRSTVTTYEFLPAPLLDGL